MSEKLAEIKARATPVLKKHDIAEASVFGSMARGEDTPASDVDILVRFNRQGNLFEFIGAKLDLEDALGRRVDLVEEGALRPEFRQHINQEKVRII